MYEPPNSKLEQQTYDRLFNWVNQHGLTFLRDQLDPQHYRRIVRRLNKGSLTTSALIRHLGGYESAARLIPPESQ